MKSLSSSVVLTGFANVGLRGLTLASKFLLVVVLARFLPPEELGVYGLMVSAVAIAIFVLGLEYHYFTIRALIGRQPAGQVAVMRDQALLYAIASAVALPLLGILIWTGTWAPLPTSVLAWFLALVSVELGAQEAGIALIALSRPLSANLVFFVRSGLWAYPAIVLTVIGVRDIGFVFFFWFFGALASIAVSAWSFRGMGWRAALSEPVNWARMRTGLRIAAPFVVTTGASMGLLFLDRFIIAANWGLGLVGIYTFFSGITTALNTLVNTGVSLIRMPRLVRAYQDRDARQFQREVAGMAKVTIASALGLAVLTGLGILPLLQVVGKAIYQQNLNGFYLLLCAAVIRSVADVPLYALYARHRDIDLMVVNLTALAVAIGLNLLLVPSLGIPGAALAAAVAACALLLSAIGLVSRDNGRTNSIDGSNDTGGALA